jgi:hypothetical protein
MIKIDEKLPVRNVLIRSCVTPFSVSHKEQVKNCMDGTPVTLIPMELHFSFWVFPQLIVMYVYYNFYMKAMKIVD